MIRHSLGIIAAIAFVILCTLLPFLPGSYDSMAIPLSAMAQIFGIVGLLLVPFGLLLIAANRFSKTRYAFSLLTMIALSFVSAAVCLTAVIHSGFALALIALVLWIFMTLKTWSMFKRADGLKVLPFYLVIVPVAVALLQFALVERAVEFSRNRAILNSAPLIAAIEQHRVAHGRYPASLQSVNPDYLPNVKGISEYRYEPHGDAYNLFFEQFSHRFGTREFVMYNPRDEHVMTSHAIDLLQLTPSQLGVERTRGHYARHDALFPHWKYFWFD